ASRPRQGGGRRGLPAAAAGGHSGGGSTRPGSGIRRGGSVRMTLNRREVLATGAAAGLGASLGSFRAQADDREGGVDEGYFRFAAGGAEIVALRDGTVRRPL